MTASSSSPVAGTSRSPRPGSGRPSPGKKSTASPTKAKDHALPASIDQQPPDPSITADCLVSLHDAMKKAGRFGRAPTFRELRHTQEDSIVEQAETELRLAKAQADSEFTVKAKTQKDLSPRAQKIRDVLDSFYRTKSSIGGNGGGSRRGSRSGSAGGLNGTAGSGTRTSGFGTTATTFPRSGGGEGGASFSSSAQAQNTTATTFGGHTAHTTTARTSSTSAKATDRRSLSPSGTRTSAFNYSHFSNHPSSGLDNTYLSAGSIGGLASPVGAKTRAYSFEKFERHTFGEKGFSPMADHFRIGGILHPGHGLEGGRMPEPATPHMEWVQTFTDESKEGVLSPKKVKKKPPLWCKKPPVLIDYARTDASVGIPDSKVYAEQRPHIEKLLKQLSCRRTVYAGAVYRPQTVTQEAYESSLGYGGPGTYGIPKGSAILSNAESVKTRKTRRFMPKTSHLADGVSWDGRVYFDMNAEIYPAIRVNKGYTNHKGLFPGLSEEREMFDKGCGTTRRLHPELDPAESYRLGSVFNNTILQELGGLSQG